MDYNYFLLINTYLNVIQSILLSTYKMIVIFFRFYLIWRNHAPVGRPQLGVIEISVEPCGIILKNIIFFIKRFDLYTSNVYA